MDPGQTIAELENALVSWQSDDSQSKHPVSSKKVDKEKRCKEKDKDKDHAREGGTLFGIFKRCMFKHRMTLGTSLT